MNYYEHFCTEHLFMLAAIILVLVTVGVNIRKASDRSVTILLRILACILLVCEAVQEYVLVLEGGHLIDFLPLQLCNLGIFVNLLASFAKGKVQGFFSEISVVLIMPGAAGAILFPDWNYRPFWNWLGLMCFFTHMVLVLFPIICLRTGRATVSFRHFWYPYLFLVPLVPPLLWFDNKYHENYLFLRFPVEGSPLELTYNIAGKKHYVLGLVVMFTVILLIEYLLYSLPGFFRQKERADR